jgi:hypothetical protein
MSKNPGLGYQLKTFKRGKSYKLKYKKQFEEKREKDLKTLQDNINNQLDAEKANRTNNDAK